MVMMSLSRRCQGLQGQSPKVRVHVHVAILLNIPCSPMQSCFHCGCTHSSSPQQVHLAPKGTPQLPNTLHCISFLSLLTGFYPVCLMSAVNNFGAFLTATEHCLPSLGTTEHCLPSLGTTEHCLPSLGTTEHCLPSPALMTLAFSKNDFCGSVLHYWSLR